MGGGGGEFGRFSNCVSRPVFHRYLKEIGKKDISGCAISRVRKFINPLIIFWSGTSLGTVLAIPTSGLIAGWLGWEAVFYIHGGVSSVW